MKFLPILLVPVSLALSSCAVKSPESMESFLLRQDGKMKSLINRSEARSEKRGKRWEDYKTRNDAGYDSWIDGIFD